MTRQVYIWSRSIARLGLTRTTKGTSVIRVEFYDSVDVFQRLVISSHLTVSFTTASYSAKVLRVEFHGSVEVFQRLNVSTHQSEGFAPTSN